MLDLEVRDLAYAPTNLTYERSAGGNISAGTQVLLPGFSQLVANGGPVLGRLTGLDPESGLGTEIAFRYAGVALHQNVSSLLPSSEAVLGLEARIGAQFEVSDSELRLRGLDLRELSDYVDDVDDLAGVQVPADLQYDFDVRVTAYRAGTPQAVANSDGADARGCGSHDRG